MLITGFEMTCTSSRNLYQHPSATLSQMSSPISNPVVSDQSQVWWVLSLSLRDAIVVVVGRCCVCQYGNETGFCGATGTGSGRSGSGRRYLDMSRKSHAADLLGVEPGTGRVQVLVKLIAVHLSQKLGLAQLVQSLQVAVCLRWWGQLTQMAVVEPVVNLGERWGAVVGQRRARHHSTAASSLGQVSDVAHAWASTVDLGLSVVGVVRGWAAHVCLIVMMLVGTGGWRGATRGVIRGGDVLVVHGVQGGHLWRSGQAVWVGVEATVRTGGVSEAPDAGQGRAGDGEAVIRAALVFVQGVTQGSLLGQGVLIGGQPTQQEAGVHPLADAFQLLLPARPILVVGVVLHVLHPEPLCFLHVGPLLRGSQGLPRLAWIERRQIYTLLIWAKNPEYDSTNECNFINESTPLFKKINNSCLFSLITQHCYDWKEKSQSLLISITCKITVKIFKKKCLKVVGSYFDLFLHVK